MYPGVHAASTPDKAALVMARSGEVVSYRELDDRSNQVAQLFHDRGLRFGDHIAIVMDNDQRYFEVCWAAERSGLHYTPVNWHLTPAEMTYVVDDCDARAVVVAARFAEVAEAVRLSCPKVEVFLAVGGDLDGFEPYEVTVAEHPIVPLREERNGAPMVYSSGTTGRPKGGKHPLTGAHPSTPDQGTLAFAGVFGFGPDTVYLSPGAPLYHAAPLVFSMSVHRMGGTTIVLDQFDPIDALAAIERHGVTHSQWVPTMFVRLLRLPETDRNRFDLSSHRVAIHAAAPCPVSVKQQMLAWWGPIVHEYYGTSEGGLVTYISPEEAISRPGSVGRPLVGTPHIVDEGGHAVPPGTPGIICAEAGVTVEYHNDPEKTASAHTSQGWVTVGDVGYLDEDGYLYLTDRKDFMINVGGVNVYPQEAEHVLLEHPEVADVAVIGVPHPEYGEEVKAVVEPLSMADAGPDLEAELLAFCRARLAAYKCPRSVDFDEALPRSPAGKLYKRYVRERYWADHGTRIV